MPLNSTDLEESFMTTDEDIKNLLSNILNFNLQNRNSEKLIITTINKLLSSSKTRLQGLEFLNLIISNCSKSLIAENALTWMAQCLIKYSGDSLKEVKLSVIGKIVQHIYNDQEFSKKFISDYISKVFESCISTYANSHEIEAALYTLTVCMRYYSSWFTSHREKLDTFITSFLDNPSQSVIEKAALAFLYLQQVGSAGPDGVNHKTNFSINFGKVCVTIQKLFDKFFENEIEIDNGSTSDQDGFSFKEVSHNSQKMLRITARRIANCLKFLNIMLLKSFPVAKEVKPIQVLEIITRGITLHHCLSGEHEKPLMDFQFSLLLNTVQIQLLQLLRIFIIWLQESSLPFSFTISKILIDCLNKIQNCQCFTTNSLYQETVYKVLGSWLRLSKNSFHTHFQTQLITCILKDITPTKTNITLSLQTDTKNKSAKAKRKLIEDRIISSGQGSMSSQLTAAEKICAEKKCLFALGVLKQLLNATTIKVKRSLLEDLYTTVINSIMDIQASKINHPYIKNECQEKLYDIFVAFYEQETLKVLPPLQLTISILNKGISNKNRHIAITCEQGLSIVEKLCQPVCPSLFMPHTFVSEKHVDNPKAIFDSEVLEDFANKNFNGNEEYDRVLETTDVSNAKLEMGVSVENSENDENIDQTNADVNFEANEETVDEIDTEIEECNREESVSSKTIIREKSIHIIDMKVVKSSVNDFESEGDAQYTEYVINDPNNELEENQSLDQNVVPEVNILKTEVLSDINIDYVNNEQFHSEGTAPVSDKEKIEDEPPLKKSRVDEEITLTLDVKEEIKSSEEIDDTFDEDGAFVDEVKEY